MRRQDPLLTDFHAPLEIWREKGRWRSWYKVPISEGEEILAFQGIDIAAAFESFPKYWRKLAIRGCDEGEIEEARKRWD